MVKIGFNRYRPIINPTQKEAPVIAANDNKYNFLFKAYIGNRRRWVKWFKKYKKKL